MIIYQAQKKYNQDTGKPITKKIFKEHRCDYSGEVIDDEQLYSTYSLNYGTSDPCFGSSGEEFEFGQKNKINVYGFLSYGYHFLQDYSCDNYVEVKMMKEFEGDTFDYMCRRSRIRAATRLIEEGIITADQLSPEED